MFEKHRAAHSCFGRGEERLHQDAGVVEQALTGECSSRWRWAAVGGREQVLISGG